MMSRSWTLAWARVVMQPARRLCGVMRASAASSVAGLPGPLLQDQAQALGGERIASDRIGAGDAPKHPALPDAGRHRARPQGGHRAVRRERVGGDMHDRALAFLIGFRAGQEDADPVRPEGEIGHPESDQLRAAEGAGEAEQEERPVAFAAQAAAADRGDPDHVRR